MPDTDIIPIVDPGDNIISYKKRGDLNKARDIYRVSSIWITNDKNEVLMAQRAFNKRIHPGAWDVGVAGTIEKDETYEKNAKKEMLEELGVAVPLTRGPKVRLEGEYNLFIQWFMARLNKTAEEIDFNKEEVVAVRWISKADLLKEIKEEPKKFLNNGDDMLRWIEMFWD